MKPRYILPFVVSLNPIVPSSSLMPTPAGLIPRRPRGEHSPVDKMRRGSRNSNILGAERAATPVALTTLVQSTDVFRLSRVLSAFFSRFIASARK
ncbi:hypothetical protein BD410DRAFT_297990 [Rickenella mellea]|uniref:Uncharacterized protein n=1 Tax=Rickenella mellea TaxID=50990 RepID=A0A4Y7PF58_9AGAM|nr:hypothetical protein BD410DRAFT_297990 [Rickenella mellea]